MSTIASDTSSLSQGIQPSTPSASANSQAQLNGAFTSSQSLEMNDNTDEFNPLEAKISNIGHTTKKEVRQNKQEFFEEKKETPEVQEQKEEQSNRQIQKRVQEEEPSEDDKSEELDRVSRGLSKLARKDAALREKERALAEQESKLERLLSFAQELEEDPAAAISKLGLDADKLYATEFEKKQREELSKVDRLERKLEEMRAELERKELESQTRSKGERWESDFVQHFENEDYKLVRAWDPTGGIVRNFVAERYHRTGKLMSPWKALDILQGQIAEKVSKLTPAQAQEKKQESRDKSIGMKNVAGPSEFSPNVTLKVSETSRKGTTLPAGVGSSPVRATRELLSDEEDMERISRKYEELARSRR